MNKIISTIIKIFLLLGSIALFRWMLSQNGLIGFMIGSLMTACFMIYFLYKKNTTVKAAIDMLEGKIR